MFRRKKLRIKNLHNMYRKTLIFLLLSVILIMSPAKLLATLQLYISCS